MDGSTARTPALLVEADASTTTPTLLRRECDPNPAKKEAHKRVLAARARYDRALAATDAALREAVSPPRREAVPITNADHLRLNADLRAAESNLDTAQATHRAASARLPLAQVNPDQQVLDIQTKLFSHAIRNAAFNTATAPARDVRVYRYAHANHEAHTLAHQLPCSIQLLRRGLG